MNETTPHFALVIFTRWPEPGRTKTRLIPAYGADGAADIHRQLMERTFAAAAALPQSAKVLVALADAPHGPLTLPGFNASWPIFAQAGADLGARMGNAIDEVFARCPNCESVVLIGVDCPQYSAALFGSAAQALCSADTVFAPAEDGGYGLVGVARRAWRPALRRALFSEMDWGVATVMSRTGERLAAMSPTSSLAMLPELWDVDYPADVERAIASGYLRRPHS